MRFWVPKTIGAAVRITLLARVRAPPKGMRTPAPETVTVLVLKAVSELKPVMPVALRVVLPV